MAFQEDNQFNDGSIWGYIAALILLSSMLVVGFTKLCYNMVKNFEPAQDGLDIEDF
jgi:hypothetical protein